MFVSTMPPDENSDTSFVLTKHADTGNMSNTYQLSFYSTDYSLESVISIHIVVTLQNACYWFQTLPCKPIIFLGKNQSIKL